MKGARIENLRSYFASPDHAVSASMFAESMLRSRKQSAVRALSEMGFARREDLETLEVSLGDSKKTAAVPMYAYVSGGVWIVKCECGGAEMVDFENLVAMCCTCWNTAHQNQWRPVLAPTAGLRTVIERVLMMRPEQKTRSWFVGEKVAQLVAENVQRGIAAGIPRREWEMADGLD